MSLHQNTSPHRSSSSLNEDSQLRSSEGDRRHMLSHAQHLKQVITDYESALIRGDHVELPTEFKVTRSAPSSLVAPLEPQVIMVPSPEPNLVKPLALGALCAILITGVIHMFVFTAQLDDLTSQRSQLTAERNDAIQSKSEVQSKLTTLSNLKTKADRELASVTEELKSAQERRSSLDRDKTVIAQKSHRSKRSHQPRGSQSNRNDKDDSKYKPNLSGY